MTRIFFSICIVALLLSACGGKAKPSTATQTSGDKTPSATELVQKASTATKALKSFHFKLTHENGTTPIPLGLELVSAEGDVGIPDKLAANVKAKAAGVGVSVKVIGIDDKTWLTNPFTRKFQLLPGESIKDIADPTGLINAVLASLTNVKLAGTDTIDGTQTYKITGNVDASALQAAFDNATKGFPAGVELWVGQSDSLPRRVRLSGPLSKDEPKDIVREIDLSNFDKPVDIKAPA